jgi:hypothetical protein
MKKFGLIIIPYLTICGALYHISYWNTFNMNGLSLISVSDILKSAVQPVIWILYILIYNAIMLHLIPPPFGEDNYESKGISNKALRISYFSVLILVIAVAFFFNYFPIEGIFFYGIVTWLFITIYLTNNYYFKSYFESEKIRRFCIDVLVAIPLIGYLGGTYNSRLVHENIEYKYITRNVVKKNTALKVSSDTLKLVGITEDFFIFSHLNNSEMIFMNKHNINDLILKDKRKS